MALTAQGEPRRHAREVEMTTGVPPRQDTASSRMTEKIPMTAEGYSALEAQLKYCREVERPRIIQQLADARTPEDLAENVEYRNATELQSQNELRIAELEN